MLKITVEILSPGQNHGRIIATAKIGRFSKGVAPDYVVELQEDLHNHPERVTIHKYPRFAASIWDLVARSIAVALTGEEKLPPRPLPLNVPVYRSGGTDYVRLDEIPEPVATLFRKRIEYSTCPIIEEDPTPMQCAHASDWVDFLSGRRWCVIRRIRPLVPAHVGHLRHSLPVVPEMGGYATSTTLGCRWLSSAKSVCETTQAESRRLNIAFLIFFNFL